MTTTEDKSTSSFQDLVELMQKLRSKDGCPWDKEQSHASLKPHLVEEAYEVIDAIDSGIPINSRKNWQTCFSISSFTARLQRKRGNLILAV